MSGWGMFWLAFLIATIGVVLYIIFVDKSDM